MKLYKISIFALAWSLWGTPGFLCAQEASPGTEQASLLEETEALGRGLEQLSSQFFELSEKARSAEGEELLILETQMRRRGRKLREDLGPFVANLVRLREEGQDVSELQSAVERFLDSALQFIMTELEKYQADSADLRRQREDGEVDDSLELEQELTRSSVDIDNALRAFAEMCGYKETLGLDATRDLSYLDDVLQERTDALAGRIALAQRQASDLRDAFSKAAEGDKASISAQIAVVRERLHGANSGLGAAVKQMDARGLDTAELKQLLISSSGRITADIFDIAVATGLIRSWWKAIKEWFATNAPQLIFRVLLFIAILLVFRLLGQIATRVVKGAMARAEHHVPQLLKNMAISFTSKAILLLGILIALSQVGVEIGPLLAGVGVAGFIIGFALQETLSNFASGLMILFYQPFDVGDVVEAGGVAGKVSHMSLVSTTIMTFDNQKLIVPNKKIWGDVIRNKTAEDIRRVDMVFGISYSDDIDRAERVLNEIINAHTLVLDDPEPMIRLNNLGDSSMDFIVRPWTKTGDYWTVFWDTTRAVKKRFDEEGISIPFPQRDVHFYQESVASEADESRVQDQTEHVAPWHVEDLDERGDDDAENEH
jgi:small conductance mechanosensitive channel